MPMEDVITNAFWRVQSDEAKLMVSIVDVMRCKSKQLLSGPLSITIYTEEKSEVSNEVEKTRSADDKDCYFQSETEQATKGMVSG